MENGKLIFTTKGCYKTPIVLTFLCAVMLDIILFVFLPLIFAAIISIPILTIFRKTLVIEVQMKASHINIYENIITGVTIQGSHFRMQYNEVERIDYKQNQVQIYFSNGTYLVQATKVEQKVIDIIKEKQRELNE